MMSSWTPMQHQIATAVVTALQSEKYKDKNYVFLHPFELGQVPGYEELVGAPLDLQTVGQRLQTQSYYTTPDDYWRELAKVFENAIAYHYGRPETKWIGKLAKDMTKQMNKERRVAEKRLNPNSSGGSTTKIKLKVSKSSSAPAATSATTVTPAPVAVGGKQLPMAAAAAAAPSSSGTIEATSSARRGSTSSMVSTGGNVGGTTPPSGLTKKPKLKLKLPTQKQQKKEQQTPQSQQTAATPQTAVATPQTLPAPPLETSSSNNVTKKKAEVVKKTNNVKANKPQPKLKLKLSLKKKQPPATASSTQTSEPAVSTAIPQAPTTTSLSAPSPAPSASVVAAAVAVPGKQLPATVPGKQLPAPTPGKQLPVSAPGKQLPTGTATATSVGGSSGGPSKKKVSIKNKGAGKAPAASGKKSSAPAKKSSGTKKSEAKSTSASSTAKKGGGNKKDKDTSSANAASAEKKSSAGSAVSEKKSSSSEKKGGANPATEKKGSANAAYEKKSSANTAASEKKGSIADKKSTASTEKKNSNNAVTSEKKGTGATLEKKAGGGTASSDKKSGSSAAPKKPKISLKLGSSVAASTTTTPAIVGAPSRGKELPKAVAAAAAQSKQSSSSPTNQQVAKPTAPKGQQAKQQTSPKSQHTKEPKQIIRPVKQGKQLPQEVLQKQAAASAGTTPTVTATQAPASSTSSTKPAGASAAAAAGSNTAAPSATSGTGTKGKKIKIKKTARGKQAPSEGGGNKQKSGPGMSQLRQKQCAKVVAGLRRRHQKQISTFVQPVNDKAILKDYKAKIKKPMDLSTVQSRLDKGLYTSIADFCLDIRRIFANCLRFNTSHKDPLRTVAADILKTAEDLMKVFLSKTEPGSYPPLLFCWKFCIDILNTLYKLVNPADGQPTVLFFLHPVSYFCGGSFPPDYVEKVSKPMDFGTVTGNLVEGRYTNVEEFASDCRLVITNCMTYYQGREDGKIYMEQAGRLSECIGQQMDLLMRHVGSQKGIADRAAALQPHSVILPRPPTDVLVKVLDELRALNYTDKATKITETAMGPFEKPVVVSAFPDYNEVIKEPMDLQTVERRAKAGLYETPEDFEYEMNLVFKNCEVYNARRNGDHLVAMSKHGARQFRRIFFAKMRSVEDPSSASSTKPATTKQTTTKQTTSKQASSKQAATKQTGGKQAGAKSPSQSRSTSPTSSAGTGSPPNKKMKLDASGASKGKAAPRISISTAQGSSGTATNAQRASSKSPRPGASAGGGTQSKKGPDAAAGTTGGSSKANQPVPLHIAIARVKESFPLRRAPKMLQFWEQDCARYFKELMRHPWISAARPKFIFHVPVPILFPGLSEAYAAKISKPMDLTTVECTLLAGNRYSGPEDFVQDVALVFANAIQFNKDARDVGDPLSCAYYDASVHLLRYSRWLSLALLTEHTEDSEHTDGPTADGLPPLTWRLTTANRKKSREEMESLVFKEPIEKSLEGDRYTWHEAECEKLLKALRHQSDIRHMDYFIEPKYPADYAAFISKPMDWEKVHRALKKRQYDKFGDVIDDLRLIFSNALKYNARHKGTDTVSGRAFESANHMSAKLEVAVNKLMLSVSDRLERERIDHYNAEREIEAAERAQEAQTRSSWKKDSDRQGTGSTSSTSSGSGTNGAGGGGGGNGGNSGGGTGSGGNGGVCSTGNNPGSGRNDSTSQRGRPSRRNAHRRDITTDFEIPFFDEEDNGQHERSYFEVVKFQKAMFEKQRQELAKMKQSARTFGTTVFVRMLQRDFAENWAKKETEKSLTTTTPSGGTAMGGAKDVATPMDVDGEATSILGGSSIQDELQREDRQPFQVKLPTLAMKKKKLGGKRKRPCLDFE